MNLNDGEISLKDIQKQIEIDYNEMATKYSFPESLLFENIRNAVKKGMVPATNYPFKKKQDEFFQYVIGIVESEEEINDAIGLFMSVWNNFPHDDMGKAPVEMRSDINEDEQKNFLQQVDTILLKLDKVADEKLTRLCKIIKCSSKQIKKIKEILKTPDKNPAEAFEYLFEQMRTSKREFVVTMNDIQPVVRALSFAENYLAADTMNGHVTSRTMQDLAHQAVARFAQAENTEVGIIRPEVMMETVQISMDVIQLYGKDLKIDQEHIDAAQHIINWLISADLEYIIEVEPDTLSALAIGVAVHLTHTVYPSKKLPCTKKDIYRLSEEVYKSFSEFDKDILDIAKKVLLECNDPLMCIPDILNAPEDYLEKLAGIAPGILLPDGAPEGSIPSPYLGLT